MNNEVPMNDDDAREVLSGLDTPRALPDDLAAELTRLLSGRDPVGQLATARDDRRPMPIDLRDRLVASLSPAAVPTGLRRRIERALPSRSAVDTRLLAVAAVATAVLLVAGGLAFASRRGDGPSQRVDLAAPGPTTTIADNDAVTAPSTSAVEVATPESTVAPTTAPRRPRAKPVPNPALLAYKSCIDLLDRTKEQALAVVGPYGLGGSGGGLTGGTTAGAPAEATAEGGDASSPAPSAAAEAFSETNVQEAGVDEPDLVKSDGRRLITITRNTVRLLAIQPGGDLAEVAARELPRSALVTELLVSGNRAVVFGWSQRGDVAAASGSAIAADGPQYSWSTVWSLDLDNGLAVLSTLHLEGTYRTARLVDGHVRLVLDSPSVTPRFVYPADGSQEEEEKATARNREIIAASDADDWTPHFVRLDGADESTAKAGRICACEDTMTPTSFSGVGTATVLTLDPTRLIPNESTAVQGSSEIVYASKSNLYLSTRRFVGVDVEVGGVDDTTIHRFDITGTERAVYAGSGNVPGYPLNQFSLSEREGVLRVATTAGGGASESFVTTFAVRDGSLVRLGQVRDLGRGERIYAVRFLGTLGYVVTFRQVDPLYVIDLSVPSRPALRGELKIPGYSAYLHPLDNGFLLGVGQDVNEQGRRMGVQTSTFDVRNPEAPGQTDKISFGTNSLTEVEQDHHALLYWAPTRTVVLPLYEYAQDDDGRFSHRSSAVALAVDRDHKLREVGRVSHDGRERRAGAGTDVSLIRRSVVVGPRLYTLSDAGVLVSDFGSLADQQWLPY